MKKIILLSLLLTLLVSGCSLTIPTGKTAKKVLGPEEAKAAAEAEAVRIRDEMIASAQRRRAEREAAEIKAFEDQAKRDLANATLKARRK